MTFTSSLLGRGLPRLDDVWTKGVIVIKTGELAPDTVVCRCSFTLADVVSAWKTYTRNNDGEMPQDVMIRFLGAARIVEDAMCERGYEAIQTLLELIVHEAWHDPKR